MFLDSDAAVAGVGRMADRDELEESRAKRFAFHPVASVGVEGLRRAVVSIAPCKC